MLIVFSLLISLTTASCTLPKHLQARSPQAPSSDLQTPPDLDVNAGPSPVSIELPAEWLPPLPPSPINILPPSPFLPPPWSPNANIDSPYPSSGVTPWDDSGRGQMVDDMPLSSWRKCPEKRLDCGRCPGDVRCRRYPQFSASEPISSPTSSIPTSPSSSTPTGILWTPESTGNENCPLLRCDDTSTFLHCGTRARCTSGFCVCDLGWKGSWRRGIGARGTEGLGTLTVYQEPGVDCDTKCETLGCGEVEQVDVGECWKDDGGSGGGGGGNGVAAKDDGKEKEEEGKGRVWDDNEIGPGELDTDTVISGAIGLPSADYVEGLADAGENY